MAKIRTAPEDRPRVKLGCLRLIAAMGVTRGYELGSGLMTGLCGSGKLKPASQ